MRSNNVKGHMKVHEKYKMNITLKTNEEMCNDIVMSLVDNALEKVEPQTGGNEDMSNKRLGSKEFLMTVGIMQLMFRH